MNRAAIARYSHPIPARHLAALAVAACFAAGAQANPTNPIVVSGNASFNQAGKVLTVTNTPGAVINWNTFSIGAGETTRFIQASASSSVLNRVLASDPSVIYGTLSSNGKVWLVNPAGIMVGAGGLVDVAGFVASTMNISNADFLAGKKLFEGTPGAGAVINQGTIVTPSGGSVYLIAPNVTNEGIIRSPQGEVILAAGQRVELIDSATPGVKVEITGAEGNATNLGEVVAEAGRIGMAGVLVRNSGVLNASSVVSEGGRIFLKATERVELPPSSVIRADAGGNGDGGKVLVWSDEVAVVDGLITAHGAGSGRPGFVETSGLARLTVGDIRVDTGGGTWLLDPVAENDFIIAPSGGDITGATISANLASNDVTYLSSNGAVMVGSGDIFVDDAITWSSGRTLTLSATRHIFVNQPIEGGTGGIVALRADNGGSGNGTVSFGGGGHVTANHTHIYYNPPTYSSPTDFSGSVTGSVTGWMLVNSVGSEGDELSGSHGLQAMATNLSGHYALGRSIDASFTAGWNGGAGFVPVGNDATPFSGALVGGGHTISGLTINRPTTDYVGLFGYTGNGSVIQGVGLNGGSIHGQGYTGSLVGENHGSLEDSSSSASVQGESDRVGGLVAVNYGSVLSSSASGAVSGPYDDNGGLVGANMTGGTIDTSYATGNVSGFDTKGGLVGANVGGTILNSYASGSITPSSNVQVGGLAGYNSGYIGNSYATIPVTGSERVGGLVGKNDSGGSIGNSYATGVVDGGPGLYTGGLVGLNRGLIGWSYAIGSVTNSSASYSYAGGLVGGNEGAIQGSFATGTVSGNHGVGGLVGLNSSLGGSIDRSYATGAVSGGLDVGGLVGENRGPITDSYATGAATSNQDRLGGLTGWNSSTIATSYATGALNCSGGSCSAIGGLVGVTDTGTVTNSFWDMDTTGAPVSAGGGTGLNTAAMKTATTFLAAGWSPATWNLSDGSYPGLTGMPVPPGPGCAGYDNCWTGAIDSLWATAGNWTAGHAPTGSENVKINVAGSPTITLAGVNPSFGSLWLAENLDVDAGVTFALSNLFTLTGGTATVDGNLTTANYVQTGGTLAGSGPVNVGFSFMRSGGVIARSGDMNIIQAAGTLGFAATQVGQLTLSANAIDLGPIAGGGGAALTTDSLTVSGAVNLSNFHVGAQTRPNIVLGRTDLPNALGISQGSLNNILTGYMYFNVPSGGFAVDSGSATPVILPGVSEYIYPHAAQISITSPLWLTQTGTGIYLNSSVIDINAAVTAGTGGIFLGRNANSHAYLVGVASKSYPANTLELTNTELNHIVTTGPLVIGDPYNAHNATPGPMQIVGPIDTSGIGTQLRLVGDGVTQAPAQRSPRRNSQSIATVRSTCPKPTRSASSPRIRRTAGVTFNNTGPLTIGNVETTPYAVLLRHLGRHRLWRQRRHHHRRRPADDFRRGRADRSGVRRRGLAELQRRPLAQRGSRRPSLRRGCSADHDPPRFRQLGRRGAFQRRHGDGDHQRTGGPRHAELHRLLGFRRGGDSGHQPALDQHQLLLRRRRALPRFRQLLDRRDRQPLGHGRQLDRWPCTDRQRKRQGRCRGNAGDLAFRRQSELRQPVAGREPDRRRRRQFQP
jgi:filamentous hemagglutinin family protein